MSPSGHVLNLLDRRCFQNDLQDVFGHVAPFPTLVPYDQYGFMPAVYRMKSNHEEFMRQLQDFTDYYAGYNHKELWTWWAQWEVVPAHHLPELPSAKKPRLNSSSDLALKDVNPAAKPVHKDTGRRALGWELFKNDDMHRILVDILTVKSEYLPNYVEFLYQWIDYHLGDGKALHAAVNHEIPSLWLYEDHPRPLGEGERVGDHEGRHLQEAAAAIKQGNDRKKPDISALERQTEQSERMQYHEVKFGLQRPIDPEHGLFTPLLNVPEDEGLRSKYYAACFKNRQRALWLLQEAGVSARKIASYTVGQKETVLETREDTQGDGFKWYYHDLPYANENRAFKEHMMRLREKQKEIALSYKLAEEARHAALNSDGRSSALALLPPESSQLSREACDKIADQLFEDVITTAFKKVPAAIHGSLKSKLFANSKSSSPSSELDNDGHEDTDDGDENSSSHSGWLEDDEEVDNGGEDSDGDGDNDDEDHDPMDISIPTHAQPAPSNGLVTNPTAPTSGHHFVGSYYASVFPEVTGSSEDINEWRPPSLFELGHHSLRPTQSNPTLHIQPPSPVTMDYENLGDAAQFSPSPFQQSAEPAMYQPAQATSIFSSSTSTSYHQPVNPFAPPTGSQNNGPVQSYPSPFISTPTLATPFPSTQGHLGPTSVPSTPSTNPFLSPPNPFVSSTTSPTGHGINPFQSTMFNGMPHQPQGHAPPGVFSTATGSQGPPGNNPFLNANLNSTLVQSTVRAPRPAPLNLLGLHTNQVFNPFKGNRAVSSLQLMTPLANLADGLTLASPAAPPPMPDVPIFIYFPKIVLSQNEIIPTPATDCLLIGHSPGGSRGIVLTKAVFLPAHIANYIKDHVLKDDFVTIETYPPPLDHPAAPPLPISREPRTLANTPDDIHGAHRHLYGKVLQAYNLMTQYDDRENELTKRWRISRGPMTKRDRGSVWEGWGVYVDRGIELLEHERIGATRLARIHPPNMNDPEEAYEEMRRREIDEMIEEDDREQERWSAQDDNMLAYTATGDLSMLED